MKVAGRRITLSAGRTPPSEFRVIPFGAYETTKGTFTLTQEGAQRIMSQLSDEGVDVAIDWEHDMVARMSPGPAPAAGWCNIELRDDGLWAVNVKWTPDAQKMLSTAEYRYFSPAFTVDEESGEITRFINLALTNRPATKKLEPLVAANRLPQPSKGSSQMHKQFLAKLAKFMADNKLSHDDMKKKGVESAKYMADGAEAPSQEEMAKCAKSLGFSMEDGDEKEETASAMNNHDPDQTENTGADDSDPDAAGGAEGKKKVATGDTVDVPGEEKFEKLTKDFTDALVVLTGESNLTKAKGVLAAMKEKAMAYDKDHEALVKLTREREEEKRTMLIEKGKAEGKLTPSLIKLFSKKPVDELQAFLDHAPVITGAEVHQMEAGTPVALLKKEDREVAMLLNRDPAEVAKGIEEERAGKFEQQILASYYARPKAKSA